jgi:hypothetical protein
MNVKPTNYKRKTPCATVKREFARTPIMVTMWCGCCGEWERTRSGSIRRYIERVW